MVQKVCSTRRFQQTVADQRAAQQILTMALNRMKQTYGLMQSEPGEAAPPPPERLEIESTAF